MFCLRTTKVQFTLTLPVGQSIEVTNKIIVEVRLFSPRCSRVLLFRHVDFAQLGHRAQEAIRTRLPGSTGFQLAHGEVGLLRSVPDRADHRRAGRSDLVSLEIGRRSTQ